MRSSARCRLGSAAARRSAGSLLTIAVVLLFAQSCAGSSTAMPPRARPSVTQAASALHIDSRMQRAAERATAGVARPVDLIAMRVSTGRVVAYTSRGTNLKADDALVGRYPVGSIFKIVSAAALIEDGLTPESPATCPASITVAGRTITNFDHRAHAIVDLRQAFAQSCNTAFATLGERLPNSSFERAAAELGLDETPQIDRPAFSAKIARPESAFDRATIAADGGTTVASPLGLVALAATVDRGRLRHEPGTQPREGTDNRVIAGLRSMMATAVANGTASGQGLPAESHAKTGTAVFIDAPQPRTIYAWLVGYRRDIAFAVLVVGGAQGGPVAGPVAARFLAAVA